MMFHEADATFTVIDAETPLGVIETTPTVRAASTSPASTYGVPSRPSGRSGVESVGPNRGFRNARPGTEVVAHFARAHE